MQYAAERRHLSTLMSVLYKVEVFRILCYNLRYEYRKNGGTASFRTGKSD